MNSRVLRTAIVLGVLLNLALLGVGLVLHPTLLVASPTAWRSLAAATTILVVYGLAGGMLLEYILLPEDNTPFGLVEFGSVFFLWLMAGVSAAYQTRRTRDGTLAALSSALISSLIWFIAALAIYYLFRGTPQQAQVFKAEGNFEDFARSGLGDFDAWVMEDFLGAGFYHLLLGPLIAAVLGTGGGLAGQVLAHRR